MKTEEASWEMVYLRQSLTVMSPWSKPYCSIRIARGLQVVRMGSRRKREGRDAPHLLKDLHYDLEGLFRRDGNWCLRPTS